jgi:hypothetical protein
MMSAVSVNGVAGLSDLSLRNSAPMANCSGPPLNCMSSRFPLTSSDVTEAVGESRSAGEIASRVAWLLRPALVPRR